MNESLAVPKWGYWVASVLFLLWNAIGIFIFYTQLTMPYDEMVRTMGKASADCFAMMPQWQRWTYGVAVWGGTFAGIALLLRRSWAQPLFLISLIALVLQYGYSFAVLHIQNIIGWKAAGFPAFVILLAAVELWFATSAKTKGWLR